jgi:two-component system response regulator RegX3
MRVLIVEDEDAIAAPLAEGLEREGYEVQRAATGSEALAAGREFDVVLLDLRLPDVDGYTVCRELRSRSNVPIIILSARGEEVDRIVGLELGADDYLVKPFGFRELLARIRAVTWRAGLRTEPIAPSTQAGGLEIDSRTRRARVDGRELALTPKEFDLLALLASDAGAVITRQRILESVWDTSWFGPTRSIDVHVAALRKKLGSASWIETVRGIGFRLVPPG